MRHPTDPRDGGHRLSEPLSDAEIERLYEERVLTQEFYGRRYRGGLRSFRGSAADAVAEAVATTFAPRTALDVGCGLGQVVAALRRRGVDAAGCDYSEAFVAAAPRRVRPHLSRQDATRLDAFGDDRFDLVLCMEVLEHLPVAEIHRCVEELRRVSRGRVIVTTPSFGANWPGRFGLPIDHPGWREDALAGRRFRQIVLTPDGLPHHGHLTLATYEWWTALFAGHGLVRDQDVENAWLEHPERPLRRNRWNVYVLNEVASPAFVPGGTCLGQGGVGWHGPERWEGDRAVRWTSALARVHLRTPSAEATLALTLHGGPDALVWERGLGVAVRSVAGGGSRSAHVHLAPGRWSEIRLAGCPGGKGDILEVSLRADETFRPSLLPGASPDERDLGVAVARVCAQRPDAAAPVTGRLA